MSSSACSESGCVCRPLPVARRGERLVVRHLTGDGADCQRLRELGFRESAAVEIVCAGGALIAQVAGTKICLSRRMAQSILVATAH